MRKYIIKMKDGSEQHVMPAVHNTLKEALLTLSHYLTGVVENMDGDSMEDPFNYTIEEVDEKEKLSESNVPFEGVIPEAVLHGCLVREAYHLVPVKFLVVHIVSL